ncbi:MAG: LysE family transporter [Rubellimicrobium sp.]|nr:LysE family transporter [Rubellimicrobium sp.]
MPTPEQLLVLFTTLTLAILSPGPAIISATQTAFARGRAVAVPYGIGLAAGASLWALFAILGLAVVFRIVPLLYLALKFLGGLYLLHLAWHLWRGAAQPMPEAARARFGTGFSGGVILNLSNPKPALFYSALIVAIFPGPLTAAGQGAIYATALATEMFWYVLVTVAMSTAPVRARYIAAKAWIDRGAALFLGALGLSLLYEAVIDNA